MLQPRNRCLSTGYIMVMIMIMIDDNDGGGDNPSLMVKTYFANLRLVCIVKYAITIYYLHC